MAGKKVVVEEGTSRKKSGTNVLACDCTHKYQDATYGAGRRLHNICKLGIADRCTVCSKIKVR